MGFRILEKIMSIIVSVITLLILSLSPYQFSLTVSFILLLISFAFIGGSIIISSNRNNTIYLAGGSLVGFSLFIFSMIAITGNPDRGMIIMISEGTAVFGIIILLIHAFIPEKFRW